FPPLQDNVRRDARQYRKPGLAGTPQSTRFSRAQGPRSLVSKPTSRIRPRRWFSKREDRVKTEDSQARRWQVDNRGSSGGESCAEIFEEFRVLAGTIRSPTGSGVSSMMTGGMRAGMGDIRALFQAGSVVGLSDAQLLERYVGGRGEIADL